ncbi:Epi-isozizaene 5-monooxygenase/(E)-beta-farnesene synthase [Enhygromyxa salina]|uniref:Epi-isozizaene 5-monooxygenase/(E)-beta-farnesene synthase n=1 Tax=Enhygromyxa salina TaxID=215803 RepID=A0A2S9Y087_9BACT|nr:cytochrome P450 [Enhygromyxa salina]PRP98513.1 Epi-isozizaene 5-monooxygenase/(E)-beta-farnesene synthase [Enhygromyxa salina]
MKPHDPKPSGPEASAQPPVPRGLPLLGNLLDWVRDPFAASTRWAEEHGDIVEMRTPGPSAYLLFEPTLVRELLVTRAGAFRKSALTRGMSCVIGDSVVTRSGQAWVARRRLLAPALRKAGLRRYTSVIVDHAHAYAQRWASGRAFDLHAQMLDFMFDVLMDVLTSAPLGPARAQLRRGFDVFWDDFGSYEFMLLSMLFDGEPYRRITTRRRRRQLELIANFDRVIGELAAQARAAPDQSLLSDLVRSWDGQDQLGEQQLREDVTTLILAAQETTAMGLTMALDLLMRHRDVVDRLAAELDAVLGDRAPDIDDLPNLPLLEAVVHESLRLIPPIWGVAREALEPTQIGNLRVAAGTQVVASAWVIQRSTRWWGPDALDFRPERWLDQGQRTRFAWFPFGAGPHLCIGMRFALIEMSLALACWVRRLRFVALGPSPALTSVVTTRPTHPVQVRATAC